MRRKNERHHIVIPVSGKGLRGKDLNAVNTRREEIKIPTAKQKGYIVNSLRRSGWDKNNYEIIKSRYSPQKNMFEVWIETPIPVTKTRIKWRMETLWRLYYRYLSKHVYNWYAYKAKRMWKIEDKPGDMEVWRDCRTGGFRHRARKICPTACENVLRNHRFLDTLDTARVVKLTRRTCKSCIYFDWRKKGNSCKGKEYKKK